MVGVVSSIPSGGNFIFADFETPRCQCCTKLPEMSDLCYLGKTRLLKHFSNERRRQSCFPGRNSSGRTRKIVCVLNAEIRQNDAKC